MADPKGFLKSGREVASRREVAERVNDWDEVYPDGIGRALLPIINTQAARCMDCGIPFCHQGCPLGNLIPEWNDLVYRDNWSEAIERLREIRRSGDDHRLVAISAADPLNLTGIVTPGDRVRAVAGEHEVRVRVDEAGDDAAAGRVDALVVRGGILHAS